MSLGKLYLIPVPLSEDAAAGTFTDLARHIINDIAEYIVENEKTARKFLKQAGIQRPQSELIIHDYGKHQRGQAPISDYLDAIKEGRNVGLMSEAGCPGIADPGADIVAEAHRLGIEVVPLVGPSSILLALMASGFNGQVFSFQGYLPIDKQERSSRIKDLERESSQRLQTQIFIETPFRNNSLLDEMLRVLSPNTKLCVAVDLTSKREQVVSQTVSRWREAQRSNPLGILKVDLHKRPAIFLIYAGR